MTNTDAHRLVISRYGQQKPVLIYLPEGEGPFPLVIFQHGRPFTMPSPSPYYPSRALVDATVAEEYALAVVIRGGYFGAGGPDVEAIPCNRPSYEDIVLAGEAAAREVTNAHTYLARLPFIDSSRIVLAGSSAGGFASINALNLLDEQVIAAISINGGRCGSRGDAIGGLAEMRTLYERLAREVDSPVYFLGGGNDSVIPLYSTRALFTTFCRTREDCVERSRTNLFTNPAANHDVATMTDVYSRALREIAQ